MPILFVVDSPDNWSIEVPGVEVVSSRSYLTEPTYSGQRGLVLFNVCRSYNYQSLGYYVSLLAEARGHRAQPSVTTIQDLRSRSAARLVSDDLNDLIQRSIGDLRTKEFELSIYFGKSIAKRHRALGQALFNQFPAPLLRAYFSRGKRWVLQKVRAVGVKDIPELHHDAVVEAAIAYFGQARWAPRTRKKPRASLAILVRPGDGSGPSNRGALKRFERAARELGMSTERITREDYGRLSQFDALFIRDTTFVNHYTYQFARQAASLGQVVIDDPLSIIRCTNKVFLKELLERAKVPMPRTLVVHRDNRDEVVPLLGLPVVIKKPDSSFSVGVVKAHSEEELNRHLDELFEESDLLVAQEFLKTDFDWRVGIFDRKPLYVCRYYMAQGHWQIMEHEDNGETNYGKVETLLVDEAPPRVVKTALKAAHSIGNGLYGVDLKQSGRDVWVMEVNDNPSIDHGFEDARIGQQLYRMIMLGFLERIEARRAAL